MNIWQAEEGSVCCFCFFMLQKLRNKMELNGMVVTVNQRDEIKDSWDEFSTVKCTHVKKKAAIDAVFSGMAEQNQQYQ